jgi:hypothetical protein
LSQNKEVEKWIKGNIPAEASFHDVKWWLENDPLWSGCVQPITNGGSHLFKVTIQHISQVIPSIVNDTISISRTGNGKVKKTYLSQLVKAYNELKNCQE